MTGERRAVLAPGDATGLRARRDVAGGSGLSWAASIIPSTDDVTMATGPLDPRDADDAFGSGVAWAAASAGGGWAAL
ncbi:hypothetical protein AB0F59_03880 [Micromonospora lupini]|uniref:hypothetical protein n=1 Tax=Micromonospora lupini TaxID=285679 RepID=UPI00340F91AC